MAKAGLLHIDLVTYGKKNDTLAPTIGVYSPIGTESSPIIQFFDSMGWHDVARRSLNYFLEKQHDDGMFLNFGGYSLETGAALWSMGEHYRYTRDDEWVRSITPKLKKACEWIINKRRDNMEDKAMHGYGMIVGKCADPNDFFHQFMLNGYQYLGLARVAEMLEATEPALSEEYRMEAANYREDIRKAFFESMAISPVIPLGDGRFIPTCPPWTETRGVLAIGAMGDVSYTHGSVYARDSMLGPLYLIFTEVIGQFEREARFLLECHDEHMCSEGVAFSQPYYSRHPVIHLRRGEVKHFLKAFYNGFAGLADRETYTFWEHHMKVSPHKTHEEGWFLMQLRYMLYMESGDQLDLLMGIPRRYMENGKSIRLDRVESYFGSVSLDVNSQVERGFIRTHIACGSNRAPKSVRIRLPHPDKLRAARAEGGTYNPDDETVTIQPFRKESEVMLHF